MPITISHYTSNESPNAIRVSIPSGGITLWFSYNTVVAIQAPWCGRVVSENVWTRTTGKHLNAICDKRDRVPYEVFATHLVELGTRLSACLSYINELELMRRLEEAVDG